MNCEVFELKELEVENYQIREVLRCILHTIMFNRALGVIRPKDVDSELFDITYAHCGDRAIEKKIEEKIDNFVAWVEKHPNKKSQVCLCFFETRSRATAWFGIKLERIIWEQWCISLKVIPTSQSQSTKLGDFRDAQTVEEKQERHAALEASLREVILQVLQFVNDKKDHIPPVSNDDVAPFPYEITIPSSSDSSFGMDMFKRMLQSGHPNMLS